MDETEMDALDRLLAEKVMGWEHLTVGYFGTESETPRQVEVVDWLENMEWMERYDSAVGEYYINVEQDFILFVDEFQPTRDISAAFNVLEKLSEQGWEYELFNSGKTHYCVISQNTDDPHGSSEQPTATLAICVAARKVVEHV